MRPASYTAAAPSSGVRYTRAVERGVWATLAVIALVGYDLCCSVQGVGHIRFQEPVANGVVIKVALIVPALAAGVLMRLCRVWWRIALFWGLTLAACYVLIVIACMDRFPSASPQKWCLRGSPASVYVISGHWDRIRLGPRDTADIYVFGNGNEETRDRLSVLHGHILLPGVVWARELYRTSHRALPPTYYTADGSLHLIFPAPAGKQRDYVTGEVALPLD